MSGREDSVKDFLARVSTLAELGAFTLKEFEQIVRYQFVRAHLEHFKHNQCRAARALGIHRNTMRRILEEMRRAGVAVEMGKRRPGRPASAIERKEKRSA